MAIEYRQNSAGENRYPTLTACPFCGADLSGNKRFRGHVDDCPDAPR